MTRLAAALALLMLLAPGRVAADEASELQEIRRAIRDLRYEQAEAQIEAALKRGHHSYPYLVTLYSLRAEVEAIAGGPQVGEAMFRRLLVLAPTHAPPSRDSPTFAVPFQRARRWVAAHAPLRVEQALAAVPTAGAPTPITLSIVSDPFAMVATTRLFYRSAAGEPFSMATGASLQPLLPAAPAGASIDYYIEVLDGNDNVVVELGSKQSPLRAMVPAAAAPLAKGATATVPASAAVPTAPPASEPTVAPPPPAPPAIVAKPAKSRRRAAPYIIGGIGLAALLAAVGVDVAGRVEYNQLMQSCAPNCSNDALERIRAEKWSSVALYSLAGVGLTTSLILFIVNRHRVPH